MLTKNIYADTIDAAAEEILQVLKEKANTTRTVGTRDNVFYFDGWFGLGASAVLRAIAQRLSTTSADGKRALAEMGFDQVIHIDCSMWESRRALQRLVAEQLRLPSEVMELFHTEDEEDDFRGVAQGSRTELQEVGREIYRHTQNLSRRFLVIFHNGSSEEIDLASFCGFLLSGYSTSKVLWTFQGRFRLKPQEKVMAAMKTATDVSLYAYPQGSYIVSLRELWPYLALEEAAEVVAACKVNTGYHSIIAQPAQVADCFQYIAKKESIGWDLDTHCANYWVCDGMLQQGEGDINDVHNDDALWRAACALKREIMFNAAENQQYLPFRFFPGYLISRAWGVTLISDRAIPNEDMFQDSFNWIKVLKLSRCTFNFQLPPFLCCYGLRFLWLDHCQSTRTSTDGTGKEEDIRRCFQRLWVLDMRYTDCGQILSAQMLDLMTQLRELNVIGAKGWDMGQLQGRLRNIRKLRVKNSTVTCSCSENNLFSEMGKMEHLEFSGNETSMTCLFGPGVSSNFSCLETVVMVDGCEGLEQISFSGCTELKNLLLGGRMGIRTLDISGTTVKTVDLSATTISYFDELYLLDCKKLCAILWPPKEKMKHEGLCKLCIDTTQSAPISESREEKSKRGTSTASTGTSVAPAAAPHSNRVSSEFDWHISVRDARLLASLEPVYFDSRNAYVEISSHPHPAVVVDGITYEGVFKSTSSREQQLLVNLQRQSAHAVYIDITLDNLQQASEGDDETMRIMSMWPCLDDPDLSKKRCYIHIQDQIKTKLHRGGEEAGTITVPWFLVKCAKILHVQDSLSSITLDEDGDSEWPELEWCRIERCPELDFVFNNHNNDDDDFWSYELRIFQASQLLKSRYISTSNGPRAFPHLTLLHLDFCPRLVHVLPLTWNSVGDDNDSLCLLETLVIAWCGDLREIFPVKGDMPNSKDLPKLKSIHLHELPSLQHICGVRMCAPNLETVKIRGCWSLRRLPDIGSGDKVVECDCEKEWWDSLEWDDRSQPNNYRPIHPHHYKKTLLRGSVLR